MRQRSRCSSIVMVEATQDRDGDDGRARLRHPYLFYRLGDRLPNAFDAGSVRIGNANGLWCATGCGNPCLRAVLAT